jgi:4-hydroxy-3-polyprenylbenzoate decarboxylase
MGKRLIVGLTGASGIIYGVRLLEALKSLEVEVHLILSDWAVRNVALETRYELSYVKGLAAQNYHNDDLAAPVASGSFPTVGMVIAPCSMKTLAGIANGYSENLLERAADVTMKEGRRLILAPRETPLSPIHLENMLKLARLGVVIAPPMPAFYIKPESITDLVDHQVGKIIDQFGWEHDLYKRWGGASLPVEGKSSSSSRRTKSLRDGYVSLI